VLTIDGARAGTVAGSRVLDLGCGQGRHTFDAARAGAAVVALDRSLDDVTSTAAVLVALGDQGEVAAPFGPLVADATAMPFGDGTFDVIVASEILEHLLDDRAAVDEAVRVLRVGGTLALSVPRRGPERINWMLSDAYSEAEGGHVRIYRRRALEQLIADAGLVVVGHTYRHGLHSPYWWLRCAVGIDREEHRLVAAYHRLLVWDIVRRPLLTRLLDAVLNPLVGKSLVLYCEKPA
jgi:SAM-dependent methyltransferase